LMTGDRKRKRYGFMPFRICPRRHYATACLSSCPPNAVLWGFSFVPLGRNHGAADPSVLFWCFRVESRTLGVRTCPICGALGFCLDLEPSTICSGMKRHIMHLIKYVSKFGHTTRSVLHAEATLRNKRLAPSIKGLSLAVLYIFRQC
jgi:hypothetical protein